MDFGLTAGDRVYLRTGTTFTVTTVGAYLSAGSLPGYETSALIDNDTDLIILIGVTPAQLGSNWVTYF